MRLLKKYLTGNKFELPIKLQLYKDPTEDLMEEIQKVSPNAMTPKEWYKLADLGPVTSEDVKDYFNKNKHKGYSQANRYSKTSADCSSYATGNLLATTGKGYRDKYGRTNCDAIMSSPDFVLVDPKDITPGDLIMYTSKGAGNHVIVYGGKEFLRGDMNDLGIDIAYESASMPFTRDGQYHSGGVLKLSNVLFDKTTPTYGYGTTREGQDPENENDRRTQGSKLVLKGIYRRK